MGLLDWILAKRLKLPDRPQHRVAVQRGIKVPMRDGVELIADRYYPLGHERAPVVLVRSPYGKGAFFSSTFAWPLAARGFQVVLQCCRGTYGSGGVFKPMHDESSDGLDTVQWIKAQDWCSGSIGTFGASYLGMTQWAIAGSATRDVGAMAMPVTLSALHRMHYAGGSLMLENAMSWTNMMSNPGPAFLFRMMVGMLLGAGGIKPEQWRHLPLMELDEEIAGKPVSFWREWMQHADANDPHWREVDFHEAASRDGPPISMVTGWYDVFAPWQLRDFVALQRSGRVTRLTVGPWRHADIDLSRASLLDAVSWFRTHLLGETTTVRAKPVRLFVVNANEWRDFDSWPPAESVPLQRYLSGGFKLTAQPPETSPSDCYRYDPENPTPSLGGVALMGKSHTIDNRALEARSDVLCYTSEPLEGDLDMIGVVEATLYVSTDAASADFFVRVCDVDIKGVSWNVCDGLQRIRSDSETAVHKVTVSLWPTAYRFKRGHRLRVQVSSGAFPRWARNTGTAEALGTAIRLRSATQTIHHNPTAPSGVALPVLSANSAGASNER